MNPEKNNQKTTGDETSSVFGEESSSGNPTSSANSSSTSTSTSTSSSTSSSNSIINTTTTSTGIVENPQETTPTTQTTTATTTNRHLNCIQEANIQSSSVILNTEINSGASSSEMKRSAVKELIERYFYQLQRGCGNPKCMNVNCASSGQVTPMTPNEIAAKAIQLFSQDAKLCDTYSQPPKVPRTHNESPSSSRSVSCATTPSVQDTGMFSPNDNSTSSSSSSGNSTVTSGSSSSSSSTSSNDSSVISSSTTNTNVSSCGTEATPLLNLCSNNTSIDTDMDTSHAMSNATITIKKIKIKPGTTTPTTTTTTTTTAQVNTKIKTDTRSPLKEVHYLDEQMLEELLDDYEKTNKYDRLLHAIAEVFPSIDKLSQSFCRPIIPITKLSSSATATKLHEILGKSPSDLKKEDLRTLEGENEKDEDSTCAVDQHQQQQTTQQQDTQAEPMDEDTIATTTSSGISDADDDKQQLQLQQQQQKQLVTSDTTVDLESLRRIKRKLFALKNPTISETLNSNIIVLAECIKFQREIEWEKILHCFVICFDMATNASNSFADLEYLERSLPKLCQAARVLPIKTQARLASIWSVHCKDQLQSLVECCQQLITLQVILDEDNVQENSEVIAITKVLKIAFYASILAGKNESSNYIAGNNSHGNSTAISNVGGGGGAGAVAGGGGVDVGSSSAATSAANSSGSGCGSGSGSGVGIGVGAVNDIDEDDIFAYTQVLKPHFPKFAEDKLEKELCVCSMDCRSPLVPFEDFYNEALSDAIQMDRDYLSYKNLSLDPSGENSHFSFMLYSFILTPATKVIALYYDSRIRMYSERNSSLLSMFNYLGDSDLNSRPDLKLKVRREHLINDALIGLEMVAMSNPKDLKKQLVVEFVGEQGIDEGGVSKEFFQLIVEEIFNPDFGMFMHQEETNTVWFNVTPFENGAQFTLIGIIIGLAIYNNIILAVNFPMVVYRKLMGAVGTFHDLQDWNPTLYRSLKSIIDYENNDMEEVFMQTFKISYTNIFGEAVEYELKPNGGNINVEQHNKQEFVDLYSDYLLNKSIESQFKAFKRGFEMVTDESPLKLLFRSEEIELLVCGSRKFDFVELEKSTEYEGYTKDSRVIKDFWTIVHSMAEESKRKLLEFTTGSDRVPVGGLSRLKLLITRNGSDSDRLPTSHTCFNVLLLPEYSSKEKLEERLFKAINNSKGFGML